VNSHQGKDRDDMPHAFKSACIYFTIVFAIGFALGTIRTLMIIPVTGELAAVALELPVMIAVSWMVCGWVLQRWPVPARWAERVAMGAIAFALLMLGELGISMLLAGRTVAQHIALFRELPAQLGLLGQMPFVVFPVLRLALGHRAA
jgi:uncharacterized membrane protein YhdT